MQKEKTVSRKKVDGAPPVPFARKEEYLAASLGYHEWSPLVNTGIGGVESKLAEQWPAFLQKVHETYCAWVDSNHLSPTKYTYTLELAKERRPLSADGALVKLAIKAEKEARNYYNEAWVRVFHGGDVPTGTAAREELISKLLDLLWSDHAVLKNKAAEAVVDISDDAGDFSVPPPVDESADSFVPLYPGQVHEDNAPSQADGSFLGSLPQPTCATAPTDTFGFGSQGSVPGLVPDTQTGRQPKMAKSKAKKASLLDPDVRPLSWSPGPCYLTWLTLGPLSTIRAAGFCQGTEHSRGASRDTIRNGRTEAAQVEREQRQADESTTSKHENGQTSHPNSIHPDKVPIDKVQEFRHEVKARRVAHQHTNDLLAYSTLVSAYNADLARLEKLSAHPGLSAAKQQDYTDQWLVLAEQGPPAPPAQPPQESTAGSSSNHAAP